jgi:hypothetical protein
MNLVRGRYEAREWVLWWELGKLKKQCETLLQEFHTVFYIIEGSAVGNNFLIQLFASCQS